eukprot:2962426-Pyramimonas_sp.AAC.2
MGAERRGGMPEWRVEVTKRAVMPASLLSAAQGGRRRRRRALACGPADLRGSSGARSSLSEVAADTGALYLAKLAAVPRNTKCSFL